MGLPWKTSRFPSLFSKERSGFSCQRMVKGKATPCCRVLGASDARDVSVHPTRCSLAAVGSSPSNKLHWNTNQPCSVYSSSLRVSSVALEQEGVSDSKIKSPFLSSLVAGEAPLMCDRISCDSICAGTVWIQHSTTPGLLQAAPSCVYT